MSFTPNSQITRGRPLRLGLIDFHRPEEVEVTCKIWNEAGETQLINGLMRESGAEVEGFELDIEVESTYVYSRPVIDLELIGTRSGSFKIPARIRVWFNTVKGPHTVLDTQVDSELASKSGFHLQLAGEPLRI